MSQRKTAAGEGGRNNTARNQSTTGTGQEPEAARDPYKPVDGASFILDLPSHVPAVWGDGQQVLWSSGEPLVLAGMPGAGKSTIIQQLVLQRMGLHGHEGGLLGLPVQRDERRVLYLALDRPRQIARSMGRMVRPAHRAQLSTGIVVCKALSFNPAKEPHALAELVAQVGAGTVVIDSLYNFLNGLKEEDAAHTLSLNLQPLLAMGSEVGIVHHLRKGDGGSPKAGDMYGSIFIQALAGSVLLLAGEAGAERVKLVHAKQPAAPVGPLWLRHDHANGITTLSDEAGVEASEDELAAAVEAVLLSTGEWLSAPHIGRELHGEDYQRAHGEAVRRVCRQLVRTGLVLEEDGRFMHTRPHGTLNQEDARTARTERTNPAHPAHIHLAATETAERTHAHPPKGCAGRALADDAQAVTEVINIQDSEAVAAAKAAGRFVYIGRVAKHGPTLWGNPYKIGKDASRSEVIELYREHLLLDAALMRKLPELRGKVLACHCKPEVCHGDVLAALADAEPAVEIVRAA